MRRRTVLALMAGAAVASPTAGVAASRRVEDRNRDVVLAWYRDVLGAGDVAKAGDLMAAGSVEHGSDWGTGLAGFRDWAAQNDLVHRPSKQEVLHTIAQGDRVAVFLRSDVPGQGEVGYMDFYRLDRAGRIAERWAIRQKAPEPSTLLHANGFITRPRPTDRSRIGKDEARNLKGALGWFYDTLAAGDVEHSSQVQQDSYIQHAQGVATGNAGFREWAGRMDLAHNPFKVATLMTVAEGDYIVCLGVGDIRGRQAAMPDWFRMRDGKLQEHWGLVEFTPPDASLPHRNRFLGGLKPVR